MSDGRLWLRHGIFIGIIAAGLPALKADGQLIAGGKGGVLWWTGKPDPYHWHGALQGDIGGRTLVCGEAV